MWLFRSSQVEEPPAPRPNEAPVPKCLAIKDPERLRRVPVPVGKEAGEENHYEFVPASDEDEAWKEHKVHADVAMDLSGVIDTYGIVLPYFEVRVELATSKSHVWVGFDNVGGAELKKPVAATANKTIHVSGPAKIAFDTFGEFEVGDTLGVGLHAGRRILYITKNGEMFRSDIPFRNDMEGKLSPTVRLRGGPCKFFVNFGGESTPFAFSPYSFMDNSRKFPISNEEDEEDKAATAKADRKKKREKKKETKEKLDAE